jgi:hypothetical protein
MNAYLYNVQSFIESIDRENVGDDIFSIHHQRLTFFLIRGKRKCGDQFSQSRVRRNVCVCVCVCEREREREMCDKL